jgi:hypothetical protein
MDIEMLLTAILREQFHRKVAKENVALKEYKHDKVWQDIVK